MRRVRPVVCLIPLLLAASARADPPLVLQNNTLRAWSCQVQGGPARGLAPLARQTLLTLGREEGELEVLLQAPGGAEVRLRLRARPAPGFALADGAWHGLGRGELAEAKPAAGDGGQIEVRCQPRLERGRRVLELSLWEALPRPPVSGPEELSLLAWNLWLRPTTLFGNGQRERVGHVPEMVAGHDVLVFSEAFDDDEREVLLRGLRAEFPHATRVVGRDKFLAQDGGVILVSRWPIEREDQVVYSDHSGSDSHADKGVLYARLRKQGRAWHVFATHMQAGPGAEREKVAVRARQMAQLRAFVEAQHIPADEPVLIAGDLNVDLALNAAGQPGAEMQAALELLGAEPLTRTGPLGHTFDAQLNPLAEEVQEYLDHVLASRDHARLEGELAVRPYRTRAPLAFTGDRPCFDLSDHFAVAARVHLVAPAPGITGAIPH